MKRRQRPPNYRRGPNIQLLLIVAAIIAALYYTGFGQKLYNLLLEWRNGSQPKIEQATTQKEPPFYGKIGQSTSFSTLAHGGQIIGKIPTGSFVQIVEWPTNGQGAVRVQHNGISGWISRTQLSTLYNKNQQPW